MLPSFRLIAAAFLCGFIAVFAGLRLATSLHAFHAALPVTAAHAATLTAGNNPATTVAPAMRYDLRFVASTAAIMPPPANLAPSAIERALPAGSRLIVEDFTREATAAPAPVEFLPNRPLAAPIVAIHHGGITGTAPGMPKPAATEQPAATSTPPAGPSEPAPAVATVDPAVTPEPAMNQQPRPNALETDPEAASAGDAASVPGEAPEPTAAQPRAGSSTGNTGPDDEPPAPATAAIATPKPQAAKAAPRAKAKSTRKRRPRNANRTAAKSPLGFFGSGGSPGNY